MKLRNQVIAKGFRYIIAGLVPLLPLVAQAENFSATDTPSLNQPTISIIIDDMGYRLHSGQRAVNLPGAVTYSFLPHAPHVVSLATQANKQHKEIMLHLPMESETGKKLGPGGLTGDMSQQEFINVLNSSIKSIPYVSGVNNHMGSLLTQNTQRMQTLMQHIAIEKKLFFVDSKTTSNSVALKAARSEGINSIQRDIFIDHEHSTSFIQKQLRKLIRKARKNGTALAIAHPKKLTLAELEKWLPELESKGVKLVPVSTLIKLRQQRKIALWKKQTTR